MNPPLRQVLHMDIRESLVQSDKHGFISDCVDIPTGKTDEDIKEMNSSIGEAEGCCLKVIVGKNEGEQGKEQGTNQGGGDMVR